MNNFIKKLSQREIGFIYLFFGVVIHFLPSFFSQDGGMIEKIIQASPSVSLFIYSVFNIIELVLIITGLIKIFSKKEEVAVDNNTELSVSQKVGYKWALFWIIIGTLLFFLFFISLSSPCETEECRWGSAFISLFLGGFAMTFGTISIAIGLIKLNKYFKYKKSQKNIPENN